MTTKTPSPITPSDPTSLESIAYASVENIPVAEPHDRDRLGYNVWRCLTTKKDSLEFAVHTAGARLEVSEEEAVSRIRGYLLQKGMTP